MLGKHKRKEMDLIDKFHKFYDSLNFTERDQLYWLLTAFRGHDTL